MKTLISTGVATCVFTGIFLTSFLLTCSASGQLVQVPNLSEFGNANNLYPFSNPPMRYQQIYAASAFPHGGTIDKIMFRNDEESGDLYGPTNIDLQVAFAYAATTVSTASATFADNIGDDFTIVLDDVIVESYDGSDPPTTFDFVLDVANTFTYDPMLGDLLVQILVRHSPLLTVFDASWSPQQDVTNRIWQSGPNGLDSTTGFVGFGSGITRPYGLVTQFEIVPEPSTFAQFGVMLLLVSIRRRKRHQ